jgi:hypothetical protein
MHSKPLIICLVACMGASTAFGADPSGTWRDVFGTTFVLSQCGNATDLCAILKDVRGTSRTPENLAYINKRMLRVHQTASNQWQGTMIFNGSQARATVTQIGNGTLSIKGCRAIFCGVLLFTRPK